MNPLKKKKFQSNVNTSLDPNPFVSQYSSTNFVVGPFDNPKVRWPITYCHWDLLKEKATMQIFRSQASLYQLKTFFILSPSLVLISVEWREK